MRFLVLGCNGMAGHVIALFLHEKGHDVTGVARTSSVLVPSIELDITQFERLAEIILQGSYDVVINCVGILNQSAEQNKDNATLLNAYLPHYLAKITADLPTRIFHMSTDCVFSGIDGCYTEDSFPDGGTFYDRSKALGELNDGKNLTLRNSIIGPDINPSGIGLLNWFMQQNGEISGYTKSIWTGQTTLQLAKTMEKAAMSNVTGLINMVPLDHISKYDLIKLFNLYLKREKVKIKPIDGIVADKSLIRTNFEFDYQIPDYDTMVRELAIWVQNHKNLYPHYNLVDTGMEYL